MARHTRNETYRWHCQHCDVHARRIFFTPPEVGIVVCSCGNLMSRYLGEPLWVVLHDG